MVLSPIPIPSRCWLLVCTDRGEREGPFANYRLHQGPGYAHDEHCISRAIDDNVSSYIGQDAIDECLSQPDFQRAWPCIETNPHTAGHRGVGGVMVS